MHMHVRRKILYKDNTQGEGNNVSAMSTAVYETVHCVAHDFLFEDGSTISTHSYANLATFWQGRPEAC